MGVHLPVGQCDWRILTVEAQKCSRGADAPCRKWCTATASCQRVIRRTAGVVALRIPTGASHQTPPGRPIRRRRNDKRRRAYGGVVEEAVGYRLRMPGRWRKRANVFRRGR